MRKTSQTAAKVDNLLENGRTGVLALKAIADEDQNVPYLRIISGVALLILDIVKASHPFSTSVFHSNPRPKRMSEPINSSVSKWLSESTISFRQLSTFVGTQKQRYHLRCFVTSQVSPSTQLELDYPIHPRLTDAWPGRSKRRTHLSAHRFR
jgi:hypothetical protein